MFKHTNLRRTIVWVGMILMVFGIKLGMGHAQVMGSPPMLTDLRVEPLVLEEGSGLQVVTVSVQVFDEDQDLKKVKVFVRFPDGSKRKVNLVDDGSGADVAAEDGRYSGFVPIDTDQAQLISFQVKAKDLEKNKAVIGTVVSIVDIGLAPTLSDVRVEPAVLSLGSGPQTVTVSVRAMDPNDDLKNVKLDRLVKAGTAKRAEKLGKLVGDGIGTVTSSPAGIDCLPDCDEFFPPGTVVTLVAVEETGCRFRGGMAEGASVPEFAS